MQVYLNDIVTAVFLFPFLSLLITVPYMVHQYRRYGSIPWWRSLLVYLFVFYLLCAYFLVILPLPESRTAVVAYAQHPQLVPFTFVQNIMVTSAVELNDPSTWLSLLKNSNVYEAVFNMLLLMPLGMFLRYYFRLSWWQVLLAGFGTSLFFEISQFTGLFGWYEHPYRLFDVDDLMTNTFGAMLGFWVIGPAIRYLPSIRMLNQEARFAGTRVSLTRRVLAFLIDMALAGLLAFLFGLALEAFSYLVPTLELGLARAELLIVNQALALLLVFVLVPILTQGQTLGHKLLKLVIVRPDACPARWYQIVIRYLLLFVMAALPFWTLSWLTSFDASSLDSLSEFSSLAVAVQPFLIVFLGIGVLVWAVTLIVRNLRAKKDNRIFATLNEHISGTRLMTIDGAEAVRERITVLPVSDVVLLEHLIAENGTPLIELMEQAGHAVTQAIITRNPEPVSVLVVCGTGNNGGDGWVIAQDLAERGYTVSLVLPKMPEKIVAEPARTKALEVAYAAHEQGLPLRVVINPSAEIMTHEVEKAEVVVDALLGTGFSGYEVKEPYSSWISVMNRHLKLHKDSFLIAVDVPSGFSAQTGEAAKPCIVADMTITMLVYKPGLITQNAARYCGVIELAPLVETAPFLKRFQKSLKG